MTQRRLVPVNGHVGQDQGILYRREDRLEDAAQVGNVLGVGVFVHNVVSLPRVQYVLLGQRHRDQLAPALRPFLQYLAQP